MTDLKLSIAGMNCAHCVHAVNSALTDLPGVTVKHVEIGLAELSYDPGKVSVDAIRDAIVDAGYEPAAHNA